MTIVYTGKIMKVVNDIEKFIKEKKEEIWIIGRRGYFNARILWRKGYAYMEYLIMNIEGGRSLEEIREKILTDFNFFNFFWMPVHKFFSVNCFRSRKITFLRTTLVPSCTPGSKKIFKSIKHNLNVACRFWTPFFGIERTRVENLFGSLVSGLAHVWLYQDCLVWKILSGPVWL